MRLSSVALSLAAHPSEPLLAAGMISGGVALGGQSSCDELPLPGSTRALAFAHGATPRSLLAASDAGHLSVVDLAARTAAVAHRLPDGRASLSALAPVDDSVVAAGDDDGGLHLLDLRARPGPPAASLLEQGDFVAAICPRRAHAHAGVTPLVVASGDGTLTAYDARVASRAKLRLVAVAPSYDDDLLSLALLPGCDRAVAGTLSGAINVYDLKLVDADDDEPDMSRFVDRFYGHPESVSAVVCYEPDDIVLTGSSDGIVRVVDPIQRIFAGVLPETRTNGDGAESASGDAGNDDGETKNSGSDGDGPAGVAKASGRASGRSKKMWPVEGLAFLNGVPRPTLAVIGHSSCVRYCDAGILVDDDDDEEEGEEERKRREKPAPVEVSVVSKKRKRDIAKASAEAVNESFFDGL